MEILNRFPINIGSIETETIAMVTGIAIGVIGIAVNLRSSKRHREELAAIQKNQEKIRDEHDAKRTRFEWNDIERGVEEICEHLSSEEFIPDILVGIPGAGVIISQLAIIRMMEENRHTFILKCEPSESESRFPSEYVETSTPTWRFGIPKETFQDPGIRILILDDFANSGHTLKNIKQFYLENGISENNIRTISLISRTGLRNEGMSPDYTWMEVESYHVYMPWGHASKNSRIKEAMEQEENPIHT